MNMKAIGQWLDRLTAWGFIVGLCGFMYDVFMVQLPENMFRYRLNADYSGDVVGGLIGIAPYVFYVSACFFARWRVGWWMIIRLHTTLIVPTLLCYFLSYLRYTSADEFFEGSLLLTMPFVFLLFFIGSRFMHDVEKRLIQQCEYAQSNDNA